MPDHQRCRRSESLTALSYRIPVKTSTPDRCFPKRTNAREIHGNLNATLESVVFCTLSIIVHVRWAVFDNLSEFRMTPDSVFLHLAFSCKKCKTGRFQRRYFSMKNSEEWVMQYFFHVKERGSCVHYDVFFVPLRESKFLLHARSSPRRDEDFWEECCFDEFALFSLSPHFMKAHKKRHQSFLWCRYTKG